jgi:hypothetical protein
MVFLDREAREDQERDARTQGLSREVNERIQALDTRPPTIFEIFICECCLVPCTATVSLTIEEYEAVRSHPARFVVVPGHVNPVVERVVDAAEGRYEVIEKLDRGAEVAIAMDPRARA